MRSDRMLAVAALVGVLGVSSTATATEADTWEPPAEEPKNGFSAKALIGPSVHVLYRHPVGGAMFGVALGAQFKDIGALHGTFLFQLGATDGGLRTSTYGGSVAWEHIFGRVRPGLGIVVQQLHLERITAGSDLQRFSGGLTAFLTVDVVQTTHANFFVGLNGELTLLPDDDVLPGAWLNFGGRFKVP